MDLPGSLLTENGIRALFLTGMLIIETFKHGNGESAQIEGWIRGHFGTVQLVKGTKIILAAGVMLWPMIVGDPELSLNSKNRSAEIDQTENSSIGRDLKRDSIVCPIIQMCLLRRSPDDIIRMKIVVCKRNVLL